MVGSVSLIVEYLDSAKKEELAQLVSKNLEIHDNLLTFCQIIHDIDLQQVYSNVLEYAKTIIYSKDDNYDDFLLLISHLPQLYEDVINILLKILQLYLIKPDNGLIYDFQKYIDFEAVDDEAINEEFICRILDFLQNLYKQTSISYKNDTMNSILLTYYGINDDKILAALSQIFRWRIDSITNHDLVWEIIFILQNSSKSHRSFSFILWLRYLSSTPDLSILQKIIITDNYWKYLQLGLISDSHEHRKYCLSILQLSVKMIDIDINNKYVYWDTQKSQDHLKEWSRYITLFEILGIDTSLHQAEAGMNDIIKLISPHSLVKSSWGFCLLSTGFTATMESVRKFSLKLLLSIPEQYLYQLKESLNFLEEIYLPNIMLASNFHVQVVDGKVSCPFGDKIVNFISNMIANLNTEDCQDIVLSVLKVLANQKDSFDPVRIYIGLGLLKGLGSKQILKFGVHDEPIVTLFESNSEGELFETICQTINIRLLLNFKFEQESFFAFLDNFSKVRGFKYILQNKELIKKYLDKQTIEFDSDNVLLAGFANKFNLSNDLFAAKLLETGLVDEMDENTSTYYSNLISKVVAGEVVDAEVIQAFSNVEFERYAKLVPTDLSTIWHNIVSDMDSDDTRQLESMAYKYKLFNNLYKVSDFKFADVSSVLSLRVLSQSRELSKTVNHFYKLNDEIHGEFYTTLEITNKKSRLDSSCISLLNPNTMHPKSNISMIDLVHSLSLKANDMEPIVLFISELWQNLVSERLQLNQKDLQVKIIEAMLDPVILDASRDNAKICDLLFEFCLSVIENSRGRRSLLPCLAVKLSQYQVKSVEKFELLDWVPQVLVRAFTVYQLRNSTFKLEIVMGNWYDEHLALNKGSLYFDIYGPEEISGKVNLMAIINSVKSKKFANSILQFILDNEGEFNFLEVKKQSDGLEEWTRVQLLSIIVSIMDIADIPLNIFEKLVETDPSPLVRAYIEWVIAYGLLQQEDVAETALDKFIENSTTYKMTTLVAYERLLFMMIQQFPKEREERSLSKLLTVIILNATANKAVTRHFSVSLIVAAFNEIQRKGLKLDENLNELVNSVNKSAITSDTFGSFRTGDALVWNILEDMTLITISGGLLLRLSDRDDFDFIEKETYIKYLNSEQIQLLNHPVGEDNQELWVAAKKSSSKKAASGSNGQSPLQTKSGAWSTIMDVDESTRGGEVVRSDLIVVSSLVDKAPNLGGICRLCDVLGAGLLTLNDISVKNNIEFKNVAVTADRWMPMLEVKMEDIKQYLKDKKKEGYTLIGLEQTDKSVQLDHQLKFPKKSLILLGKEKEGVPGDLLAELDFCVEIKQVGVIRSMNIQTATAVIVHAYSVQHC